MNVKDILNEQFKEIISEETLNTIEEAFNAAVEEKSKEKINLETERVKQQLDEHYTSKLQEAIDTIDNDHTAKLKQLVEAIDTDHAVKLQKLVKGIDAKHTSLLKQVIEKYENQLEVEAKGFQDSLVEQISNYLDLYIDKQLPKQEISEAVQNIKAKNQLAEIRRIVGVTEEFVDSEVKEALIDGKKIIDSLRSELNQSLKENVALNVRANKAESFILLEKKTAEMPSAKKQFVTKLLGTKSPQYIEENFSYVVDMFEKEQTKEVDEIKESVKQQFVKTPQVDRQIIEEKQHNLTHNEIERAESSDSVSGYLNEMKNLSRIA
jgi:hypothetical protein